MPLTTTKHSPTPWRVLGGRLTPNSLEIVAADGRPVIGVLTRYSDDPDLTRRDFEYIVMCVNTCSDPEKDK